MKKIKVSLMSLAIVAAVASAFAAKPAVMCDNQIQYYWDGGSYREAGTWGQNFDCDYNDIEVCTYYRPNPVTQPNTYAPCKMGTFILFAARKGK